MLLQRAHLLIFKADVHLLLDTLNVQALDVHRDDDILLVLIEIVPAASATAG